MSVTLKDSGNGNFILAGEQRHPDVVVRPRNWPLYDSVRFENGSCNNRILFRDSKRHDDGHYKTKADCNMTLDGMLGYPNVFDVSGVCVHVDHFSDPKDVVEVFGAVSWEFVVGMSRIESSGTLSSMTPYLPLGGSDDHDATEEGVARLLKECPTWRFFRQTPIEKSGVLRIGPSDCFRISVSPVKVLELTSPIQLKFILTGTLYCPS